MPTARDLLADLKSAADPEAWLSEHIADIAGINGNASHIWAELVARGVSADTAVRAQAQITNSRKNGAKWEPTYPFPELGQGAIPAETGDGERRHPLDKPYRPVDLGRIGDYVTLAHELTGAPLEFHQLIGLAALAAAMHNAQLPVAWAGKQGLRPNLYGCIVAPSSVYHKSTALRQIHTILNYGQMANTARLPAVFTEEGLLAALADTPAGIVVRDEIGILFGSHRRKHLETVTQALTQVYDGDSFTKRLAGAETIVTDPYISIVGATTPGRFYDSVRTLDWEDGFLVRWLWVVAEEEPDFDHVSPMLSKEHMDRQSSITRWMGEVHNHPATAFRFKESTDYVDVFELYRRTNEAEAYQSEAGERVASIVSRYNTYGLKFSMLLSVARGRTWGEIHTEDLIDGCQLADNYKRHVLRLLGEQHERSVDGGKLQVLFTVIRDWEQRFAKDGNPARPTRRLAGLYANLRADVRDKAIDNLIEIGAVAEVKDGRTTYLHAMTDRLQAGRIGRREV